MAYTVTGNTFKPFSFEELLKPVLMYEQAYKEQEALIDAAREKEFNDIVMSEALGADSYALYNQSQAELKAVSDELSNGLSKELKPRIREAVRNYKTNMNTLKSAYTNYQKEVDRRVKAGPDMVYQDSNLSLDSYLYGNAPKSGEQSLKDITTNVGTNFSHMAKGISQDTWDKLYINGKVNQDYYEITKESGLNVSALSQILDDKNWAIDKDGNIYCTIEGISKEEGNKLLDFRRVIQDQKDAIDYNKYSQQDQRRIDAAIATGASYGIGETTHKYENTNALQWKKYYDDRKDREEDLAYREKILALRGKGSGNNSDSEDTPYLGTGAISNGKITSVDPTGTKLIENAGTLFNYLPEDALENAYTTSRVPIKDTNLIQLGALLDVEMDYNEDKLSQGSKKDILQKAKEKHIQIYIDKKGNIIYRQPPKATPYNIVKQESIENNNVIPGEFAASVESE